MSIRTSLFPSLLRSAKQPLKPSARLFHFLPPTPQTPKSFIRPDAFVKTRVISSTPKSSLAVALGLGLGLTAYSINREPVKCESPIYATNTRSPEIGGGNPPPQSMLSFYELGFGAVCGICSGVFVKKGLRAVAFILGGLFVLLQVGR